MSNESCEHVVQSTYGVAVAGSATFAPCPWCQIKLLESKLHTAETNLSNAKALLEAFVIAMRSGATTEDILETVRDGVGLTKETPKP